MALVLEEASREEIRLRMMIDGPTKSGKSMTMLRMLEEIAGPEQYGVIESEFGRIKLYVGDVNPDGGTFRKFKLVQLNGNHEPGTYGEALQMLEDAGCVAIGIDSMSHEWKAILAMVDRIKEQGGAGSKNIQPWGKATPTHEAFLARIMRSPAHIIGTARAKMAYEIEKNAEGKNEVKRLGLAKIARDDNEYEFDIILSMDERHYGRVTGARAQVLDGMVIDRPGAELARTIMKWLRDGAKSFADVQRDQAIQVRARCVELAEKIAQATPISAEAEAFLAKASAHLAGLSDDAAGLLKLNRTIELWTTKLNGLTAPPT